MKLHHVDLSPNCLRVRAVALELGLALELVSLEFGGDELRSDRFRALNPNGKVPVLEDDGVVLWESRAINAYLAAKDPESRLYPVDVARRALVDQWSYWQAIHLGPAMQRVAFERFMKGKLGIGAPDESKISKDVAVVTQSLRVLDTALEGRSWICEELSLADFALATTFMYRNKAGMPLTDFPNVSAWIERLEARPSWQAAVAPIAAWMALGAG